MMSQNPYALNINTNRLIKKSTSLYRKLKKLNQVREIENPTGPPKVEKVTSEPTPEKEVTRLTQPLCESPEPEYDESKLQRKLADISTDVVKENMKQLIKNQKLNDEQYDLLLKKMLFQKLCIDEPKKEKKKEKEKQPVKKKGKQGTKFKLAPPPSSSESDSDSD